VTDSPPYYTADWVTLHLGDSLNILPTMLDASVDAVVCDPPYEISFMGRAWDASGIAYNTEVWRHCWRVLKPGGHLLAFGGTRTYHRMTVAIEDAGFEIRDSLHWIYGSGFPKSLDVSKAIDRTAGAERKVIGKATGRAARLRNDIPGGAYGSTPSGLIDTSAITAPATEDAARWQGWGTALKPAHEPIVLARKPLAGTVAGNALAHGTRALNIDGCRVAPTGESRPRVAEASQDKRYTDQGGTNFAALPGVRGGDPAGRWPTNILLGHGPDCIDGGECQPGCPVAEMDQQTRGMRASKPSKTGSGGKGGGSIYGGGKSIPKDGYVPVSRDDEGGASRFFPVFRYEAKAPASERPRLADGTAHSTVKPLALMQWLIRLVTPPGGTVLDPFAGSGTTLAAALREGMTAIGVEQHEPYAQLCIQRLSEPYSVALFGDIA
jgi:site-specific DNA-methyltransferase (adenine-specific)